MTSIFRLTPLALLLAAPLAAQDAMSPRTFEAFAEGKTLYFTLGGQPYGAEQYFAGRRSVWRFEDGTCQNGQWWDAGDRICFRYEEDPLPQCWRFRQRGGGFDAALVEDGSETGFVLELSHMDQEPLPCPGPGVGA